MVGGPEQQLLAWVRSVAGGLGLEVVGEDFREGAKPGPKIPLEELSLPGTLKQALRQRGILGLSGFQWEAYRSIVAGQNTAVVSGTGSGKTEAWLLPILCTLDHVPGRVGCVVAYPTKALARDQLERIRAYCGCVGLRVEVYHGDTPQAKRAQILSDPPDILVTNPDMLNLAIRGSGFRSIVSDVRYFVLDDFHVYQGVFGANMAWLIWRLKRLWGQSPVFVGSSATISQPEVLFERVFGERCRVVRGEGGVSGQLHVLLGVGGGRSKRVAAAQLFERMVSASRRTILFVDSHLVAELLYKMLRGRLGPRVGLHRAGLTAEQRERVEEDLKVGRIVGVVSTPTLELGIDIGELDTVINYDVTSSYSRYVQRAGRVGRRGGLGLIVQLLGDDPISRYYRRRPREFLGRELEPVYLDPENTEIIRHHLLAAAVERPLREGEVAGGAAASALGELVSAGLLVRHRGYYGCTREGHAQLARWGGLRGSGENVAIMLEDGVKLGERELPLAVSELHPHAIYLHLGSSYRVTKLDLDKLVAYVRRIHIENIFTRSIEDLSPRDFVGLESGLFGGVVLEHGGLTIRKRVVGYVVKDLEDNLLAERPLEEPISYSFRTKALRFRFRPHEEWGAVGNAEGFHALEHALISAAKIAVGLSDEDLGGVSNAEGEIYIYDARAGGSGASHELFKRFERTLRVASEILGGCDCADGCPKCVYTVYCGNNNAFLSRRKASELAQGWLSGAAQPAAY